MTKYKLFLIGFVVLFFVGCGAVAYIISSVAHN
jgi:hypothetical protein